MKEKQQQIVAPWRGSEETYQRRDSEHLLCEVLLINRSSKMTCGLIIGFNSLDTTGELDKSSNIRRGKAKARLQRGLRREWKDRN